MPFNAKNIHNIKYTIDGIRPCISWCEGTAHRYHIWINNRSSDDDFAIQNLLYKNSTANHDQPGYFHTRQLDPDAKINREMINYVIGVCKRNSLVSIAKQEFRNKQIKEAEERAAYEELRAHGATIFRQMRELLANGHQGTYNLERSDMQALLAYAPNEDIDK